MITLLIIFTTAIVAFVAGTYFHKEWVKYDIPNPNPEPKLEEMPALGGSSVGKLILPFQGILLSAQDEQEVALSGATFIQTTRRPRQNVMAIRIPSKPQ